MSYNPLLCFTTYNQLGMTKKCLEYAMDLGFDILVIDDCSIDGTQEYIAQIKVNAILKSERKGLTDSWNRAYRYWKGTTHSHIVICNNDVLIPKGAIEGMLSDYPLVVPTTTVQGAGYACKDQGRHECDEDSIEFVQFALTTAAMGFDVAKCWTGFCMCMNCKILDWELPDGNLFDKSNINVGNDDDLAKRVKAYIALGSFVWHEKGISFNKQISGRDDLSKIY